MIDYGVDIVNKKDAFVRLPNGHVFSANNERRYLLVKITAHVCIGGVAGKCVRKNHRNLNCGLLSLL
jgi:hypothetical protein